MYFWKINSLKENLYNQCLPEKEALKYLIASILVYKILLLPPQPSIFSKWHWIAHLSSIIISVAGIIYCFYKNNGSRGKYFLATYLSLGWVLTIRILVLLTIPLIIAIQVINAVLELGISRPSWDMVIVTIIVAIVYYWRLGIHIKHVAVNRRIKQDVS